MLEITLIDNIYNYVAIISSNIFCWPGNLLVLSTLSRTLHGFINYFEIVGPTDIPTFCSGCKHKGRSKKWMKILEFPHISVCLPLKDDIGE